MNKTSIFVSLLALILIAVVGIFSFALLIPTGKEYRKLRLEHKKELSRLEIAKDYYEKVAQDLSKIKSTNKDIIEAFERKFDQKAFEDNYKKEFSNLYLTELENPDDDGAFKIYEVHASTKIYTPQSFYNFLEAINSSGWVIEVNFPINFQSDDEMISASFTMRVYSKPSN